MGAQELSGDTFYDVLYYFDWWDCPRSGLCVIDGQPTHFDCPFSDDLDDYPAEFLLWPATEKEVADGLAAWQSFVEWRTRLDTGEMSQDSIELAKAAQGWSDRDPPKPPTTATRAGPTWQLDRSHSFANGIPQHLVRWRVRQ